MGVMETVGAEPRSPGEAVRTQAHDECRALGLPRTESSEGGMVTGGGVALGQGSPSLSGDSAAAGRP